MPAQRSRSHGGSRAGKSMWESRGWPVCSTNAPLQIWVDRWHTFIASALRDGDRVTTEGLREIEAGKGGETPTQRATPGVPSAVSDLSAWLGAFNAENYAWSQRIEVPGQYDTCTGRSPPDVASHAFIASVEPKMRTMSSLREPKRVVFVANTEVAFPFLAKVRVQIVSKFHLFYTAAPCL